MEGALLGEGFTRHDFSADTGYIMGMVRDEAGYLFGFVRTHDLRDKESGEYRPIWLCILVDDLDRCDSQTVCVCASSQSQCFYC